MLTQPEELNHLSLPALYRLFSSLQPPNQLTLKGLFKGSFVGPGWLRRLDTMLLGMSGLRGWWGKDFYGDGYAVNVKLHKGQVFRLFPMTFVEQTSYLNAQHGLALRYNPDNPFPWPLILDELRQIHPELILGMTLAPLGPLRYLALPFVLQHRESIDEL